VNGPGQKLGLIVILLLRKSIDIQPPGKGELLERVAKN